jgi:hypothetical protein
LVAVAVSAGAASGLPPKAGNAAQHARAGAMTAATAIRRSRARPVAAAMGSGPDICPIMAPDMEEAVTAAVASDARLTG